MSEPLNLNTGLLKNVLRPTEVGKWSDLSIFNTVYVFKIYVYIHTHRQVFIVCICVQLDS